tara:strand:- start:474 stop:662 length:189 start_codon:yes stop_codon:yes gene_type:complete
MIACPADIMETVREPGKYGFTLVKYSTVSRLGRAPLRQRKLARLFPFIALLASAYAGLSRIL